MVNKILLERRMTNNEADQMSSVADQILFEILEELRKIRELLENPD